MEITLNKLLEELHHTMSLHIHQISETKSCVYPDLNGSFQKIKEDSFENKNDGKNNELIFIPNKYEKVFVGKKPVILLELGGKYKTIYDSTPKELSEFTMELIYNNLRNICEDVEYLKNGERKCVGFRSHLNDNDIDAFLKKMIFKEGFGFYLRSRDINECLEIYRQKSGNIVVRDFKGKYQKRFKSNEFFEDILENSYPGRVISDDEIHNQLLPLKYFKKG